VVACGGSGFDRGQKLAKEDHNLLIFREFRTPTWRMLIVDAPAFQPTSVGLSNVTSGWKVRPTWDID
jgi:hypothetical protein